MITLGRERPWAHTARPHLTPRTRTSYHSPASLAIALDPWGRAAGRAVPPPGTAWASPSPAAGSRRRPSTRGPCGPGLAVTGQLSEAPVLACAPPSVSRCLGFLREVALKTDLQFITVASSPSVPGRLRKPSVPARPGWRHPVHSQCAGLVPAPVPPANPGPGPPSDQDGCWKKETQGPSSLPGPLSGR